MDIDLEELAAIIELLDKTEFTQFRFEKGDLRIAVSRGEPLADAPSPRETPTPAPDSAEVPAETSPRQASPGEASPAEAPARQASPGEASPAEAPARQASPREALPRDASSRQATPGQATPGQATPGQASLRAVQAGAGRNDAPDLADDEFFVRSPMLGTFYSAPKPGASAFVQEGQAVDADAVLCIIEVMKLMNSVPAGEAGVVRRMLVRDGELVEYDQPLFVVGRS